MCVYALEWRGIKVWRYLAVLHLDKVIIKATEEGWVAVLGAVR